MGGSKAKAAGEVKAREQERHERGLLTLYSECEELGPLLHSIVERACRLLGGRGGGMYLYDPIRKEAVCVVSYNTPRDYTGVRLKLGEGAAGRVIQTGEPLLIEDYRRWEGRARAYEQDRPFTAVISAPMKWEDEVIGVIHVLGDTEGSFTEDDLQLLLVFADQAALTLKNAKLYQESRRRAEGLAMLHRISLELTSQRDLPQLLEEVVRSAIELLRAKSGGLYLYDPESEELELILSVGMSRDYLGTRLKLGEGLAGKVAQTGEPQVVADYRSWEGRSPKFAAEPLTSVISIPLKAKGKLIGVLNISTDEKDRLFGEEDLRLARLFADQAAIALENARLYREEHQRARELEALARISQTLSSSLELEEVLEKALEEMLRLSGLETGAIYLLDGGSGAGAGAGKLHLHLKVHRGLPPEFVEKVRVHPLGHGLTGRAALEQRVVVCTDVYREFPELAELARLGGLRSQISLPLSSKGKLIGVLNLNSSKVHTPTEEELRVLTLIAERIALAVENAMLYQAEQRRAKEMAVIGAIGAALSRSLEPEALLRSALEGLLEALDFELGAVYLIEEGSGDFVLVEQRGLSPEFIEAARRNPKDHYILGRVIRSRRPLEVHEHEFLSPEAKKEGLKYAAYVPLFARDRPLGVLAVGDRSERALTPEEFELLESVGQHLSLALEQAQLHQEVAEWREKYRSLVENEFVGIYIIQDNQLKYANEGSLKLFGYSREELSAIDPLKLVHPEDRELIRRNLERRLQGEVMERPYTFRGLRKDGEVIELEVFARRIDYEGRPAVQGILIDVTKLRQGERLRRDLLEIAREILASHDIEHILRRVAQAIIEHSPFQRAAVSLYDITAEVPLESPVMAIYSAGLTREEEERLIAQGGMPPEYRRLAFTERFRIGNSYYIPHDQVPWGPERGLPGRVRLDGWHPNDFLFIPLRSEQGIIGHISVDDPRVPGVVTPEVLEPLELFAGLAALAVERAAHLEQLRRQEAKLKELSIRDPLTGLYNRRYFNEIIGRELERARRLGYSLAFLMLDLDNFRRVNNLYGHLKGDEVLRAVAKLLVENVRASDMVFRYGGDEFLILMPKTSGEESQKVIERLRRALRRWNKGSGLDCEIGFSAGVALWSPGEGKDEERRLEELLEEADRMMYQGKLRGCGGGLTPI